MEDCIFCKIVAGDVSTNKVWENDRMLAFLCIPQMSKGHTLVIPKRHAETLLDTEQTDLSELLPAVKEVMKKLQDALQPDGFNVGINHGKAGGQGVRHLHIHVIPRWNGDGGENIHAIIDNPGDEPLEKLATLFA